MAAAAQKASWKIYYNDCTKITYTVDDSFGRFQYIWLEFHLSQIKSNSLTILSCTWHRYKIFVRMITTLSFKIWMVSYDFDLFDWRFELLVIFFFNLRLFIFWFTLYLFLRIKISTSYHNNVGKTKVPEDFSQTCTTLWRRNCMSCVLLLCFQRNYISN